jgi:molybdopterin-containing oxidoreductase family iron-sulfur binding subunit
LEDWGTHYAVYQPGESAFSIQQPLMENLYADTKGLGDIILSLLKMRKPDEYNAFADYYAYLNHALAAMKAGASEADETPDFWVESLQKGLIKIDGARKELQPRYVDIQLAMEETEDAEYPLYLVPSPRMGLFDGRHANLPWLQESPDQISKVVWDSWAEIHPTTASKLGIKQGDVLQISSPQGMIEAKAILIKGIHHDVIAVPLGQGHTEYGRYARNRGANPLRILNPSKDHKTGELAMYATRVKVSNTGKQTLVVRLGSSDTQHGRKFVRTVPVDVVKRTEGA